MYTIYVIESLKNRKRYTGYTRKNIEQRLLEHNKGCNIWSRHNRPFRLIYYEYLTDLHKATKRELFLKSGQGREFIKSIVPY